MKVLGTALILAICLLSASAEAGRRVSARDLGERWPFTVDEGEVDCIRGPDLSGRRYDAAVFRSGGKTYALNGAAKHLGHLNIDPIWRVDPAMPKRRMNLTSLIYLALRQCDR